MSVRVENWIVLVLSVLVSLGLIATLATYSSVGDSKVGITGIDARLEALESKKAPATSKRFTSDDAQDLIACLRLNKSEQRPCLDEIQARFKR